MGLDFSHSEAHWSYGGFARFRARLAAMVGILGYNEISKTDDPRFERIKDDPVRFLLAHSDCDGDLTVSEMKKLAPRLTELVTPWPEDHDKKQALELISGMREAIKEKKRLKFQ